MEGARDPTPTSPLGPCWKIGKKGLCKSWMYRIGYLEVCTCLLLQGVCVSGTCLLLQGVCVSGTCLLLQGVCVSGTCMLLQGVCVSGTCLLLQGVCVSGI